MSEPATAKSSSSGRMACSFCKKRKLRCDRQLPQCESCQNFGSRCEYGPLKIETRGYTHSHSSPSHVRRLENRLGRVEQLLRTKREQQCEDEHPSVDPRPEMTGKGLVESNTEANPILPGAMEELERDYFAFAHPSINILHPARYLLSVKLNEQLRPPDFLRHAVCALAASASSNYSSLRESFYQSARRLLQETELKDQNADKVSLAHAQAWILIATFELSSNYIARTSMSISRAVRLVQMLRLHRIDALSQQPNPQADLLAMTKDWTEREERRRLFWYTFLMDRYGILTMGWPTLIDTRDIRTHLPVRDDAYENSIETGSLFLSDIAELESTQCLSSFAAQIISIDNCVARVQDIHRLDPCTPSLEPTSSILAKTSKIESLLIPEIFNPTHLSIPPAKLDPGNVIFNMASKASVIALHRAALIQAGNSLSVDLIQWSRYHCFESASLILQVMKLTTHWDLRMFHPCTPFCIYAAALIYAQSWNLERDPIKEDALKFLIETLHKFKVFTKLSGDLITDLRRDFGVVLAQLEGEETDSTDLPVESFDSDSQFTASMPVDQLRRGQIVAGNTQMRANPIAADFVDVEFGDAIIFGSRESWTVDDPDIASFAGSPVNHTLV